MSPTQRPHSAFANQKSHSSPKPMTLRLFQPDWRQRQIAYHHGQSRPELCNKGIPVLQFCALARAHLCVCPSAAFTTLKSQAWFKLSLPVAAQPETSGNTIGSITLQSRYASYFHRHSYSLLVNGLSPSSRMCELNTDVPQRIEFVMCTQVVWHTVVCTKAVTDPTT